MYIPDSLIKHWANLGEDIANAAPVLVQVTIASGQSLSSAAALGGYKIIGFALPAAFTKAHLTFQASWDGTNYYEIFDSSRRNTTLNQIDLDADPARRRLTLLLKEETDD